MAKSATWTTRKAFRDATEQITERLDRGDLDGAWSIVIALQKLLRSLPKDVADKSVLKAFRNAASRVLVLRLGERLVRATSIDTERSPGDISAIISECLAVDAELVRTAADAIPSRNRWATWLAAIAAPAILWSAAVALYVHTPFEVERAPDRAHVESSRTEPSPGAISGRAGTFPLVVFAMIGLTGLGAALAYEILRPGDQWFQHTLAQKLGQELPCEQLQYKHAIIDLHMRAGRLKRGAAMALGGAVVAIILFTMFIYSRADGIPPNVIIATRVGGGLLLMFIVGTLMAAHAFTLRLAAHYEAIGDLLRIGDGERAKKLLMRRIRFVMFWPPRLAKRDDAAKPA